MKFKIVYLFVCFFALNVSFSDAQQKRKLTSKVVVYKDNVRAPLSAKEHYFIKEVYANKFDAYVLKRPQKLKDLKNLLRNRVEIKEMPTMVAYTNKYKLLSEFGLFNYYNPELVFDKTYIKESFNVLKYNLEFFASGSMVYRIDNTNYFILIKSQHQ